MDAFDLVVFSMLALVLLRNSIVYRFTIRRITEVRDYNLAAIDAGVYDRCDYDTGSYGLALIDLSKWTYRQFYPVAIKFERSAQ